MWLKNVTRRPLGKQTQGRLQHKDIICVHTMVGNLVGTTAMFERNGYGGTESHFGIGGKWGADKTTGLDGVVYQYQDTDFTADANLEGNWHILSIETADNAPQKPEDIEEWTHKQFLALTELIVDLCLLYNIPPKLIPDTKPGRRGLAYHYQGVEPNLVKGGEKWSSAGHTCPGPIRIQQFIERVIPEVQARLKELSVGLEWNSPVKLTEKDAAIWGVNPNTGAQYEEGDEVTYGLMVRYPTLLRRHDNEVNGKLDALAAKVDVLLKGKADGK